MEEIHFKSLSLFHYNYPNHSAYIYWQGTSIYQRSVKTCLGGGRRLLYLSLAPANNEEIMRMTFKKYIFILTFYQTLWLLGKRTKHYNIIYIMYLFAKLFLYCIVRVRHWGLWEVVGYVDQSVLSPLTSLQRVIGSYLTSYWALRMAWPGLTLAFVIEICSVVYAVCNHINFYRGFGEG